MKLLRYFKKVHVMCFIRVFQCPYDSRAHEKDKSVRNGNAPIIRGFFEVKDSRYFKVNDCISFTLQFRSNLENKLPQFNTRVKLPAAAEKNIVYEGKHLYFHFQIFKELVFIRDRKRFHSR